MAKPNPYQAYQQNAVTTASPGELTLMLYNGCLKFLHLAKVAMEKNNIEEKNKNIQQDIITELMVTLNMDIELSHQMLQLYDYAKYRLIEANIHNDLEGIKEVEELMTEFRDTWKQVIQIHRQSQFKDEQGGV